MKFYKLFLNKTALTFAIETSNVEIVKLLVEHPKIDLNILIV